MRLQEVKKEEEGDYPRLILIFSDELDLRQHIAGLVQVRPEVPVHLKATGKQILVDGDFTHGQTYELEVHAGIRSRWGTRTEPSHAPRDRFRRPQAAVALCPRRNVPAVVQRQTAALCHPQSTPRRAGGEESLCLQFGAVFADRAPAQRQRAARFLPRLLRAPRWRAGSPRHARNIRPAQHLAGTRTGPRRSACRRRTRPVPDRDQLRPGRHALSLLHQRRQRGPPALQTAQPQSEKHVLLRPQFPWLHPRPTAEPTRP